MKINTINRPGANQLGMPYHHESGIVTKVILELLRLMEPNKELPVTIIEFNDLPDYSNEYLLVLEQNTDPALEDSLNDKTDIIYAEIKNFTIKLETDYLIEIKRDFTNNAIIFTVAFTS